MTIISYVHSRTINEILCPLLTAAFRCQLSVNQDFPSCENYYQHKLSVELRHNNQHLSDECYEIQEYGMEISEDTQTETQAEANNHEI